MEGDYRVFHLKGDIAFSILYMLIVTISAGGMLITDSLLYKDRLELFVWLVVYRVGYILFSVLIMILVRNSTKLRVYDRLVFTWLVITVFFLLLFNFTRPASLLSTAFDAIVPFAVYLLSPLKLPYNILLAFSFTTGTLSIDYFYKSGMNLVAWNNVITAQLVAHALGLLSSLQIQSYRRKSFRAYMQEKDAKEMVAYLANIDPLTKSLTRRHFFNIAETEFRRFLRYHRQFSVLVLDADHFKLINDTYGHYVGDIVLLSLSLVVLEKKRAQDTFGRLGGEEFGLLLPETNVEQAKIVAERIQKTWAQTPCKVDDRLIHSTISIGVSQAGPADTSFEDVLRRADRMMYKAKESGRNRVAAE